jgi:hypothetical protein
MEGLEKFEKRVFPHNDTPTFVFEPTGLAWIPLAIYLRAHHPECARQRKLLNRTTHASPLIVYYTENSQSISD